MKTAAIILSFLSLIYVMQTGASTSLSKLLLPAREHPSLREVSEQHRLRGVINPSITDKCSPRVGCRLECSEGFLKDEQGCEICSCKSASFERRFCPRSRKVCSTKCDFGHALDRRGCSTCTCNPGPVSSANGNEGSGSDDEDSASENEGSGNAIGDSASTNENSASESEVSGNVSGDSASKNENSASESEDPANTKEGCLNRDTCKLDCHHGFVLDFDLLCEVCECQPDLPKLRAEMEASRPKVDCSRRPSCKMYCPYGFKIDANGCDICSCVYHRHHGDNFFVMTQRDYHMPFDHAH